MVFTLEELTSAYGRAKAEVFHENLQLAARHFVKYEEDLYVNLNRLLKFLNNRSFFDDTEFWFNDSFHAIIKDVDIDIPKENGQLVISKTKKKWAYVSEYVKGLDFRIISDLNVDFHIISSLWIQNFAQPLEEKLSDSCYGSRLVKEARQSHFRPYAYQYKKWQQDGIKRMREKFEEKNDVIAITGDIKSFYHNIDISFLSSKEFLTYYKVKVEPGSREEYLNKLLVKYLTLWSKNVYQNLSDRYKRQFKNGHVGIPIGLAASKVIANLLLGQFDEQVEQELAPLYYGRYVDDIFIVLKDISKLINRAEVWKYISQRVPNIEYEDKSIRVKISYAPNTEIVFNNGKEKIFFLDRSSGMVIINDIEDEINKKSSEWRFVPNNGTDLAKLSEDITFSGPDSSDTINSLRKSDNVSIRKLKFANYLNKIEEIVKTHPEYFWKHDLRKLFYVVRNFATSPDIVNEYLQYIPRILELAMYTENFRSFHSIYEALFQSIDCLGDIEMDNISKDYQKEILSFKDYLKIMVTESMYRGLKPAKNYDAK